VRVDRKEQGVEWPGLGAHRSWDLGLSGEGFFEFSSKNAGFYATFLSQVRRPNHYISKLCVDLLRQYLQLQFFWIIIASDRRPERLKLSKELKKKIVRFRSGRVRDRVMVRVRDN